MSDKRVITTDLNGKSYDVSVSELTWRPASYAIVIYDDTILLINTQSSFHLPGGSINLGETPEEAVIRELKEETGLGAKNPRLVGSLSTFFTYEWQPHELHNVQSLLLYYACELVGEQLSSTKLEPHEEALGMKPKWLPLNKLDSVKVGSTVDWRPIVKRAVESR